MCGIYLSIGINTTRPPSQGLQQTLSLRGPDSQQHVALKYQQEQDDPATTVHLECFSTVLSLRGEQTTPQPLGIGQGILSSFLCWNGEAWLHSGTPVRGSDSLHVFRSLSQSICSDDCPEVTIARTLAAYSGPHAFAFYDMRARRLYFGRDFLGRRSLLYSLTEDGIVLSSVAGDDALPWLEVEADGIYWVDLKTMARGAIEICKTPYVHGDGVQTKGPPLLQLRTQTYAEGEPTALPRPVSHGAVASIHRLLLDALRPRLLTIPSLSRSPVRVAILFSGGIDCTILARLAHDLLDAHKEVDLLNVAFENPRKHGKSSTESPYEQCPDRKTALSSLQELQAACPGRRWRLVKINVPYAEFLEHRPTVINLIRPHNTEMDLSIACALYFAARGAGEQHDDGASYKTPARVLLSGLGADELFGGYTRHDTAFRRGGLRGLEDELALDISRLGKRNLGRDDRVISHWAKEARFPFLDEEVVRWAMSVPVWDKCGFGQEPVIDASGRPIDPAKLLLRRLALELGMPGVANERKRAIQFGARTAKMEVGKVRGTQVLVTG